MATDWNRPTFRTGAGNYDELHAVADQEQEGNAEKGKGEEGRDDGRGSAVFDGAPKPQPGDELYATLYQARAEATERATALRNHPDLTTAADFAALVALSAQQAAGEITQPSGQQRDRGNLQSLRMEHAAGLVQEPSPPGEPSQERTNSRNGLLADFVTTKTEATARAEVEAERSNVPSYQRRQSMDLTL